METASTIHPSKTLPSHTSMLTGQPPERHGVLWNNVASAEPGGWFGRWSSERTVADVAQYLEKARRNVLFIHLTDPDAAGHRDGWMSEDYGRDVTIPWIAWGQGVKQGALTQSTVRTMDTAATVLWLLAVAEPAEWMGEPVLEAYTSPAVLLGD